MTVTVFKAAAARRVFDTEPDVARTALAAIEHAGRRALDELDGMLATLRETPGMEVIH